MQNIPFMDIAWYFGDDMDCWLCGLILLRNKGAAMGTNIYKAFFIIALLANLTNASIFVESIGLGESVEAAKKDAISNGIREAVGEYVRAKQTLENENLNEQILNFSNAYLLEYKQLSVNRLSNGLYEVKAKLEIEDGKLVGVLKDLQVDVKNVDDGTFKSLC